MVTDLMETTGDRSSMSALGLTCREAFTVFSQNESLRLQQEVRRLESEIEIHVRDYASLKDRFIRKQQSNGYAGEGCYDGLCAMCERAHDDCHCDWTCKCFACDNDRYDLKSRGWTDDEIRTIRRRFEPAGCIQVCDVCGADYDEQCLCDWTCECRVCEELRDKLFHEGWTDQQLKDYNRYHRLDAYNP